MANEEHLAILRQGVEVWNKWREENDGTRPDLARAQLLGVDLAWANLEQANLRYANFARANLAWAFFTDADLAGANLEEVNLTNAILVGTHLVRVNLGSANLEHARIAQAVFGDVDLSTTQGLERCLHTGPNVVDHRTFQRSGNLPDAFLRGCGLSDWEIEAAKLYHAKTERERTDIVYRVLELRREGAIQFHSCFISYSSKDDDFVHGLHADLQDNGVRCWFAPEDLKIGDQLDHTIDTAIRVRDKLLLILSETSVASAWVSKEVKTALEKEAKHDRPVLFPVRLDNSVFDTTEQWAHDIKRNRHIGDFRNWKDHDQYRKGLERLLRDLKVER